MTKVFLAFGRAFVLISGSGSQLEIENHSAVQRHECEQHSEEETDPCSARNAGKEYSDITIPCRHEFIATIGSQNSLALNLNKR